MPTILVTGGGGYIGTVLVGQLLEAGHEVRVLDWFVFGRHRLDAYRGHERLTLTDQDVRTVKAETLNGVDVVCDLAALSNDPAGELDQELTRQINYRARARLGRIAKAMGVRRYILASSCSVYGANGDVVAHEDSPVNPITTYAECNVLAEAALFALSDADFAVTAFRNATAFGLSARMRFDLVINIMTMNACKNNEIIINGDGEQHRPFIHIADISRAFVRAIAAERHIIAGQVFNLGIDNMKISDLARMVAATLPFRTDVAFEPDNADARDYTVSFDKMRNRLGFEPQVRISDGILEVYFAILANRTAATPDTRTVDRYREIIHSGMDRRIAATG